MFSWIIEKKAKILKIEGGRYTLENSFPWELIIGQSIAHDGACMTIEKFDDDSYTFFAMEESLKKTNFWSKKEGDFFNVERCLKVWDRIDGHFVTGHIDVVWNVEKIVINDDSSKEIFFSFPEEFDSNMIPKGSITVNGVSLTIVHLESKLFSVSLIPLTQEITNLWLLECGDKVNLEFDMLGKYMLKINK